MNCHDFQSVDMTVWLDRLVDDQLDHHDRLALLKHLENESDGWKLCALAFLEAQTFQRSVRSLASESQRDPAIVVPSRINEQRSRPDWKRLLVAASILAGVFALGRQSAPALTTPSIAGTETPKVRPPAAPIASGVRLAGYLRLDLPDQGEHAGYDVPVFEAEGVDPRKLVQSGPVVPDYLRTSLEREGYQVQQSREIVSVGLDDGRRVAIPIDQVQLLYVGQTAY